MSVLSDEAEKVVLVSLGNRNREVRYSPGSGDASEISCLERAIRVTFKDVATLLPSSELIIQVCIVCLLV